MTAATDLRHMTSHPTLVSPRHLHPHSPARSPNSIPSSPTSVHSSSSAIFERDIEPLSPPSPQHHSTHLHRAPRSKATEQIEHSVPSVLDSAAAILASIEGTNDVSIVTPAPEAHFLSGSGFASPIGSFRSRSPSPTIGSLGRNSLLLSSPQRASSSAARSPPSIQTNLAQPPPVIVTPTSAHFSVADESDTAPNDQILSTPPPGGFSSLPALSSSPASSYLASQPNSPLSATSVTSSSTSAASKRLSFISYADLLTSTPTSTLPLSSLTTAASTSEPPPHIASVSVAASYYPGSAGTSLRGFNAISPGHDLFGPTTASLNTGQQSQSGSPRAKRNSAALGLLGPGHPAASDDVGGEWEREGLGRGLEERLDVLYGTAHAGTLVLS
ncbi:hypothetical protein DXG03_009069 [Asterophora parasitica]|uniref:Uncharacterized protein n=1 Tax=Asterophora parasitica TaxID=117018 RepID=A0A9P7G5U6_9AGAR|nr:hypothetical protein DXG03_009069 [Asterophora parasitica]